MLRSLFVAAAALAAAPALRAEVFCVGSSSEIAAALARVEADGHAHVYVRVGTYVAPPGGWQVSLGEKPDGFTLIGGWLDAECTTRTMDASRTVLDGGGRDRILTVDTSEVDYLWTDQQLYVFSLTFRNGRAPGAGAIKIGDPLGPRFPGYIIVEGNLFLDNVATAPLANAPGIGPGALYAATDGGELGEGVLVNSNVFARSTGFGAAATYVESIGSIEYINNTVVGSRHAANGAPRVAAGFDEADRQLLTNNVFWDNDVDPANGAYDLVLDARSDLLRNLVDARTGVARRESGTLRADPRFSDPARDDYAPAPGSPLLDAGYPRAFSLHDVRGEVRVQGTGVDIGAYEGVSPGLFRDGFERP